MDPFSEHVEQAPSTVQSHPDRSAEQAVSKPLGGDSPPSWHKPVILTQQRQVAQLGALGTLGSEKDVNVFENLLELALDKQRPPLFETMLAALNEAVDRLTAALKAVTRRELEAVAIMAPDSALGIRYEVSIRSSTTGRAFTKVIAEVAIEHNTGLTVGRKVSDTSPPLAWLPLEDEHDIEALIGQALKEPAVFAVILVHASPYELK